MKTSRAATVAGWTLSVLLFIAFVAAGFAKLTAQPMMVAEFQSFGYPLWFMSLTGILEIVGALLVVIPKTSWIGAALLASIMVGALFSHLLHGQAGMTGPPFVLLVLAVVTLILRRPQARRVFAATS